MVDFGNTLKILRLQNKFTQAELAKKLGLTKSVISAYENGLRLPSYDVLIHIAKIFNVSTDYLLGLEHKREVDLSGLTPSEIDALMNLIQAMKRK
ncbi:MAG: helix-turn-helix transcriptional regulator [Lachnoclostridium sp.]